MTCVECESNLVFYLYGELSATDEEAIEQHLDGCANCRACEGRLAAMHRAVEAERQEPSLELLSACRQGLAATLSITSSSWPMRAGWPAFGLAGWSWRLAGCAALVAVGFFAARVSPGVFTGVPGDRAAVTSSVSHVEPLGDGRVRIVMQDSVAREMAGRIDDQAVRALLVSAARQTHDPAVRVDSLEMLRSRVEYPEVRAMLLEVLRKDPNDGVRMKALDTLRPVAEQPEVRTVLLDALREDQNAMVRAHAVDLLTMGTAPSSDLAGALQELMQREENVEVRRQGQRVLRSMNASLETF
jgi:hypothetical protein